MDRQGKSFVISSFQVSSIEHWSLSDFPATTIYGHSESSPYRVVRAILEVKRRRLKRVDMVMRDGQKEEEIS
jgi:hypothetical protein